MRSNMDHTVLPANYTMPAFPSWAFTRWRFHWMRWRTSNCSSLLIYWPHEVERLSRLGWLTYSGRLTHTSGHPSNTGRAQDGERTLAGDWRSTAEPCGPTWRRGCALVQIRSVRLCKWHFSIRAESKWLLGNTWTRLLALTFCTQITATQHLILKQFRCSQFELIEATINLSIAMRIYR